MLYLFFYPLACHMLIYLKIYSAANTVNRFAAVLELNLINIREILFHFLSLYQALAADPEYTLTIWIVRKLAKFIFTDTEISGCFFYRQKLFFPYGY